MGRTLGAGRLAVGIATFVACVSLAAPSATATPGSPATPLPNSMAAIGDSFTWGFASGPPECAQLASPCAYSWATGTSVNSHYARILSLNAAINGQAHNVSLPGSSMLLSFSGQATAAAASQPDYVTVMLGAGDVCLYPTMTSASAFETAFRSGMDVLAANANTKVLVASVWNLESFRAAAIQAGVTPGSWGPCGYFFNQSSDAVRASMMVRVGEYNQILASVCAEFANCRFDGDALFDHTWIPGEVNAADKLHPNVAGQEMISDVLWRAGYWGSPSHPSCRAQEAAAKGAAASGKSLPVPCR